MTKSSQDEGGQKCPRCKGSGKVLLLFSWAECPTCGGSGFVDEETVTTGKYKAVPNKRTQRSSTGSSASTRCDDEQDESYFDDGLEFDDAGGYGGGDAGEWEGDDS